MNIPQKDLDHWRAFLERVRSTMFVAKRQLAQGNTTQVDTLLQQTAEAASRMGIKLEQAGAQRPPELPERPMIDLHLMDTPANRRYAQKLREAWEAGLLVDQERFGPNIGTDGCAQIIEMVLADVEMEIYGPEGSRLER